jgi:hypothetical protein
MGHRLEPLSTFQGTVSVRLTNTPIPARGCLKKGHSPNCRRQQLSNTFGTRSVSGAEAKPKRDAIAEFLAFTSSRSVIRSYVGPIGRVSESVCTSCLRPIAYSPRPEQLTNAEKAHKCPFSRAKETFPTGSPSALSWSLSSLCLPKSSTNGPRVSSRSHSDFTPAARVPSSESRAVSINASSEYAADWVLLP